jgi:isopentenyl diphosphate isomerase/L-lactate dehydrogenase-like FMN-dependent dehydrogenase
MKITATTRRTVLGGLSAGFAGAVLLKSQQAPLRDGSRVPVEGTADVPRVPAMDELKTVQEFETVASYKVTREAFDYTAQGAEGEFTLRRNREAFDWVELVPRDIVDVSSVNTATQVLGTPMKFPMFVSPTAAMSALNRDGEMACHKGATAASDTPMIISANASIPVDKIAAAASSPVWWQLYPQEDMDHTKELLDRAVAAGAKAIVMTVDQQAEFAENNLRDRHLSGAPLGGGAVASGAAVAAAGIGLGGRQNQYRLATARLWYNWQYVDQVRKMLSVPLLAKGVLTGEDAKIFVDHGIDGIYVSNHGGRSLDYDPSTLEVLAEIVDAVPAKVPVIFDSGIRSGSDILKALALGAKAVCLGRAPRWGLAAYGVAGVQRVLEMLQAELVMAMAQTGVPDLASIDRSLVRTHFR